MRVILNLLKLKLVFFFYRPNTTEFVKNVLAITKNIKLTIFMNQNLTFRKNCTRGVTACVTHIRS